MKNPKKLYGYISEGPKYDLIAKWIGSKKKILDIGCGVGEFSLRLVSNDNEVVGVEASEENFRIASKRLKVYFGDFLEIQFQEEFDIILFADVLEHMYYPEQAMKKAWKLCDETILCVPNFESWFVKLLHLLGIKETKKGILHKSHVYYFTKGSIEKMIKDCGFEIINYSSPAPKKIPKLYNHLICINPKLLGFQFIYRCGKIKEEYKHLYNR